MGQTKLIAHHCLTKTKNENEKRKRNSNCSLELETGLAKTTTQQRTQTDQQNAAKQPQTSMANGPLSNETASNGQSETKTRNENSKRNAKNRARPIPMSLFQPSNDNNHFAAHNKQQQQQQYLEVQYYCYDGKSIFSPISVSLKLVPASTGQKEPVSGRSNLSAGKMTRQRESSPLLPPLFSPLVLLG